MEALIKKDISNLVIDEKENIKELYEFYKDNTKVGYGIIKNDSSDQINIFINEKYRSNGYGKLFFGKMLELLNDNVSVKSNNIHMSNIISYYNGMELSRRNGIIYYIIPRKD